MDKKSSKCRFRVMKFEENAISSSKNEMRTEYVKPPKGSRASRPRAPERTRSPDPQASVKDTTTKQDRKSARTVGKKPAKKIILDKRSNTITGELKRIFSSSNNPEVRDSHQVGDKAKKTKKKAKGKRKKSNIPDYLRRYEDAVTYECEADKSPRRARKDSLRYEQKRISPSMYYLSAGDSIEREICKAPRELNATHESCDCLPAEITCPNASHYKDSLSSRNSRKCSEDCTIWRAGEGKNLPICHCSSLNINVNRHTTRRNCNYCTNKSGVPVHPTSTKRQTVKTSIHVNGQTSTVVPRCHTTMCNTTSSILKNNASTKCQTLHKNSTGRMFEKSAQPSKILPKMTSIRNTGCNSTAMANTFSKNVTVKSPSYYTKSRSSHQLMSYNFSACKCDVRIRSNPSCQCRTNATCKCPSSNWTFKGRSSLTAGTEAQCLEIPTIGSVTESPERRVSAHTDYPALCSDSQNIKRSASTMPSFRSNLKAAYHKARTAITGTGDAPPTCPACVSAQTGGMAASGKLCHSVSCPVDYETNRYQLIRSPSEMPKTISRDTSYWCSSKISKTKPFKAITASPCDPVKTEHKTGSDRPRCNASCGSFRVIRTQDCGCSAISVLVNGECINIKPSCLRMRRKPPRRCRLNIKIGSFFKIKKVRCFPKLGKDVEPDIRNPQKYICSVAATTSVLSCADAETGCLNDSCHAGPRRVYALFQPIFTRSTCYFYYIVYVVAMIVCSPIVAIIYFCRFVTSPIRPSGCDCPTCLPPRPCPHALIRIFKFRQWFDKPTVCPHTEPTTRRVGKCEKTSSSSRRIRVVCQGSEQTSGSKLKKKHQGVINQSSTCRQAQECNKGTKKRQYQTYYSEITSKCSDTRSCKDQKRPNKRSKPGSRKRRTCDDKLCNKPRKPCEDQCSKPPPCQEDQKKVKPPPCDARKKKEKKRPCKRLFYRQIMRKFKKIYMRYYKQVADCMNVPKGPREEICFPDYEMPPNPPCFMYDACVWKKKFFRKRPKRKDNWYRFCTYFIAAVFWCPLGLCLYITFKCVSKCYR